MFQKDLVLMAPSEEAVLGVGHHIKSEKANNSMWCPKLYINHFCYPGPYLSKNKVGKFFFLRC